MSGCSGGSGDRAEAAALWSSSGVNTVSRAMLGGGVAAVTALRPDATLETAVFDLDDGRKLWTRPAVMKGRLAGMGVQPPAVTSHSGQSLVTAVEPGRRGKAALVARDAITGKRAWSRPVAATFGPEACGAAVCVTENTAGKNARLVALDPASGRPLWKVSGVAAVEHSDPKRTVLFRMSKHPTLEARHPRTGKKLWTFRVENAVGKGMNLSGGSAFGTVAPSGQGSAASGKGQGMLVGYVAPYQKKKNGPLSSFGFFGLRLADGKRVWARRNLLRVFPSANPAVDLTSRKVTAPGSYGGFERLDPRTGRTTATVAPGKIPNTPWLLALPEDLSKLAFLSDKHPGTAYSLPGGAKADADGLRTWSFCSMKPEELKIKGQRGFYPMAALCAYDTETGRRLAEPGAPPAWYTGVTDGWRAWRDERGILRVVRDGDGTAPGMYGG